MNRTFNIEEFCHQVAENEEEFRAGITQALHQGEAEKKSWVEKEKQKDPERIAQHEAEIKALEEKKAANAKRIREEQSRLSLLELNSSLNRPLDPAYDRFLPTIITLIKTGRADSVKEALNLAITEEKQDQEAAAHRAHEERMEELAKEEQVQEEERAHEEEQRREMREKDEAFQAREREEKERREQEQKELKERQAGNYAEVAICFNCTHRIGCPIKGTAAALSCTHRETNDR